MAGLLRQLVEASQLQAVAEPWAARAFGHRVWTARRDCQGLPGAFRGQDRQDEDRLREGSGGDGLAFPQGRLSKLFRAFAVPALFLNTLRSCIATYPGNSRLSAFAPPDHEVEPRESGHTQNHSPR